MKIIGWNINGLRGKSMNLFSDNYDEIIKQLKSIDLNTMSPIDAINFLENLKKQLK